MKEHFVTHWKNGPSAMQQDRIDKANAVIAEYRTHGLTLTLRQLYYQFVARGWLGNTKEKYKALGATISKAREQGLIDWRDIEDRGRGATRVWGDEHAADVLRGIEYNLIIDPWADQDFYVEVWIEKDALIGTVEQACDDFRVTRMACKGYLSASAAYNAGQRFDSARARGKDCVLIHLGDHDPSGIDMTRDNQDRAELFSRGDVTIRRIALNMDQIDQYGPPPNPAKLGDSRAEDYVQQHGYESWELDALDPQVLDRLVRDEIERYVTSRSDWDEAFDTEKDRRMDLRKLSENWTEVEAFLQTL